MGLDRNKPHHQSAPGGRQSSDDEDGKMPYPLKHKLFLLLDTPHPKGNDWRMLATKLGLEARIFQMQTARNPTLEVLQDFEKMDRAVGDLEVILRDMKRSDAADVVKQFIDSNSNYHEITE